MLSEIHLGKSNVPGDLNLCLHTHLIKNKWGGTELRNRKCTFLFLPMEFFCTISVFLYFSSATSANFFHIEKEDKLSSFFYIKRTQAYRKKLTPSFSSSLTHMLIKSFLFL